MTIAINALPSEPLPTSVLQVDLIRLFVSDQIERTHNRGEK